MSRIAKAAWALDARRPSLHFQLMHRFKRLTIGTLVLRRIPFVGTHLNLAQRAVFAAVAMIFAGIDSTLDAVIFIALVHNNLLYDFIFIIIISRGRDNI